MKRGPIAFSSVQRSLMALPLPFRFLTRPQLLTRIEPLPVGRDIPSTHRCDRTSGDTVDIQPVAVRHQ